MNISKEISVIRELLNLTQQELASKLEVSFQTINRWENEKTDVEDKNVEKVYLFAYQNKIYLNDIYEQLFLEEYQKDDTVLLFHGCKNKLELPIDLKHSKENNDFGPGFYLGETFKQAATYIANSASTNVSTFTLNLKDLQVVNFDVNRDWMIAIAYYRGWIDQYKWHPIVQLIVNKVDRADIVKAPIADNRMFDIISEFVRGEITDLQCEHALAATNLGMQYVVKSDRGLNNLMFVRRNYLTKIDKEKCIKQRLEMNNLSQSKVKVARIEYRGKGQYIDELLK